LRGLLDDINLIRSHLIIAGIGLNTSAPFSIGQRWATTQKNITISPPISRKGLRPPGGRVDSNPGSQPQDFSFVLQQLPTQGDFGIELA
jgi:hypothetical protein